MKFDPNKIEVVGDVECYRDYFCMSFKGIESRTSRTFEFYAGHPLDVRGLVSTLRKYRMVTFNGLNYDMPMLALSVRDGITNQELKNASDAIIQRNLKPWELAREFVMPNLSFVDHIDLMEVAPGTAGLKIYSGRLHSKRMQDLPIAPDDFIIPHHRATMVAYNINDLDNTIDLYNYLKPQLDLRIKMSEQYDIDLRSKSDAQIAEAVIKSGIEILTGNKVYRPDFEPGFRFKYTPPTYISFKSERLCTLLGEISSINFSLSKSGSVELPTILTEANIVIADGVYRMGIGGLHSSEKSVGYESDDDYQLFDIDVTAFYPNIILSLGLYPEHLGRNFLTIYKLIVDRRIEAKRKGDKVTDLALKITINGSFGKFGSRWSALSSPQLLIQTTITGQLSLLMLIEAFENNKITVISANTDGIVLHCPRHKIDLMRSLVKQWEVKTQFNMEETTYNAIYSRDVNNYIAIKEDGKAKTKGAFGEVTIAKNPTNMICVDAVVNYLTKGVPIEETIEWSTDIRKFVTIRQVKGGGIWVKGEIPDIKSTQIVKKSRCIANGWYEVGKKIWSNDDELLYDVSLNEAYIACFDEVERDYLGKAVRWYYGKGAKGHIGYKLNGNCVAGSQGAIPVMDLPDTFPLDLDHNWYIKEAYSMLKDLGVQYA